MAVGDALSGVYKRLDDGFYKVMDFLELRGVPVYNYNDFLEARGVPVFPFTTAIVVVLIALLYLFLVAPGTGVTVVPTFLDDSSNTLNQVRLTLADADGEPLFSDIVDSGTRISLSGVRVGQSLSYTADKEGYEGDTGRFLVEETQTDRRIELFAERERISPRIRLTDPNGTAISDARVVAEYDGGHVEGIPQEDGTVVIPNIPVGEDIRLKIAADNYEAEDRAVSFASESDQDIELTPLAAGAVGKSVLTLRVFDRDTKQILEDVHITIRDAQTDTVLADEYDADGEFAITLPNGTSLRYIVEKEGYVSADAADDDSVFTLRGDQSVAVNLERGGTKLYVIVTDAQNGTTLPNATVTLFAPDGSVRDENTTGFSGSVTFTGLDDQNANRTYYASAYADGYVVGTVPVTPARTQDATVALVPVSAQSAGTASIFVARNDEPVPGATLRFFADDGTKRLPLGIPRAETDIAGYFGATVPANINLYVSAQKDALFGDANRFIEPLSLNRIPIDLFEDEDPVTLHFEDAQGYPINEAALDVYAQGGDTLFTGELEAASASFLPRGNRNVHLRVTTPDGLVHEEQISTAEKEQTIVIGDKRADGLAPEITFVGVENAQGATLHGLERGKTAFLVFDVAWPQGQYDGGIHVRTGSDAVGNAHAQHVWIEGLLAGTESFFYGRTYNPTPAPGNTAIDRGNAGAPGERNKLVEAYYASPQGTTRVKVRVKTSEEISAPQEIHFRAWRKQGEAYLRDPKDTVLGAHKSNETRSELYAETHAETLPVFEGEDVTCQADLCTSYAFIDADGQRIPLGTFAPEKGGAYALEMDITAERDTHFAISANTPAQNPRIGLANVELVSGAISQGFPEQADRTSVSTKSIPIQESENVQVRVYFTALEADDAVLLTQVDSDTGVIPKELRFRITDNKEMSAEALPRAAQIGEDFAVRLLSEDGRAVENGLVALLDADGKVLSSVQGTGAPNRGRAGVYRFKNTFEAGLYTIRAQAPDHRTVHLSYTIAKMGVLEVTQSVYVPLGAVEKAARAEIRVKNKSTHPVTGVTVQQDTDEAGEPRFEVTVDQIGTLAPREERVVGVNVLYNGERERDRAQVALGITGIVAGRYPTHAQSTLSLDYNPVFDPACLEVTPGKIGATLVSDPGATRTIPVTLQNNCPTDLVLSTEAKPKSQRDQGLLVTVQEADIGAGETKETTVTIENRIQRTGYARQQYQYTLYYKSEELEKTIPLSVRLWNRRFAVQSPDHIELYLAQTGTERASASSPLFIRNAGNSVIENLSIGLGTSFLNDLDYYNYLNPGYGLNPQTVRRDTGIPDYIVDATTLEPLASPTDPIDQEHYLQSVYNEYPGIRDSYNSITPNGINYGLYDTQAPSLYRDTRYPDTYNNARGLYNYPSLNYGGGNYGSRYGSGRGGAGYGGLYGNPLYLRSSSTLEGVEVRIEPAGTYPALPPGQSMFPPAIVVASGNVEKSKTVSQNLIIEGVIDGVQQPLKTVNLVIHVSAPSCLQLAPETIELGPATVGTGTLSDTIVLQNNCSEAVRLAGATPREVGGNEIGIDTAGTGQTIAVGQTARMKLSASKTHAADVATQVRFYGALSRSGKRVVTDPLTLSIIVRGEEQAGQASSPVSKTFDVPVCGEKETVKLAVPARGSQNDCSTGFCDAQQLAHFLAGKIAKKVTEFERTIASTDIPEGKCLSIPGACRLSELGVKSETYTVYLAHDQLSPALFSDTLAQDPYESVRSIGFRTEYLGTQDGATALETIAGKGFGRQIRIPEFSGCGKYVIKIDMATELAGNRVVSGRESVVVYPVEPKQDVDGCSAHAQNIANFLPLDKDLEAESSRDAWPGTTDSADTELEETARQVATSFFGTEDRFSPGAQTNTLAFEKGFVPDGILEITMPAADYPANPQTIGVKVREELYLGNLEETQENIKEVARIFSVLKTGLQSKDLCVSADRKHLRIKSARPEFGAIAVSSCGTDNALDVFVGTPTCCTFSVTGSLADQVVSAQIVEKSLSPGERNAGINWEKTNLIDPADNRAIEKGDPVTLAQVTTAVEQAGQTVTKTEFRKDLLLCTEATTQYIDVVRAQPEATIEVKDRSEVGQGTTEQQKVTLDACPVHPYEMASLLALETTTIPEGESRTFYAVLAWNGNPEAPDAYEIAQWERDVMEQDDIAEKMHGLALAGALSDPTLSKKVQNELGNTNLMATHTYLGTCVATQATADGILGLLTGGVGWVGGIFDVLLNCGLPATIGYAESLDEFFPGQDPITALADSIDWMLETTGNPDERLRAAAERNGVALPQVGENEQLDTMYKAGLVGTIVRRALNFTPLGGLLVRDPAEAAQAGNIGFDAGPTSAKSAINDYHGNLTQKETLGAQVTNLEKERTALQGELAKKVEDAQKALNQEIDALTTAHKADVAAAAASGNTAQVQALTNTYDRQVEGLRSSNQQATDLLKTEYDARITEKSTELGSARSKITELDGQTQSLFDQAQSAKKADITNIDGALGNARAQAASEWGVSADRLESLERSKLSVRGLEGRIAKELRKNGATKEAAQKFAKAYAERVRARDALQKITIPAANAKKATKTLNKAVSTLEGTGSIAESTVSATSKLSRLKRIRNFFSTTRTGKVARGIASLGTGIIANTAGLYAAGNVIANTPTPSLIRSTCATGNCFVKYNLYKATVTQSENGPTWSFSRVTDGEGISEEAAFLRAKDCQSAFSQTVSGNEPIDLPEPTQAQVTASAAQGGTTAQTASAPNAKSPPASVTAKGPVAVKVWNEAQKKGVPPAIAVAVADQESNFGQNPATNTNPYARGIMQVAPKTGSETCGLDEKELEDPEKNIPCGVDVLAGKIAFGQNDLKYGNCDFSQYNGDAGTPVERGLRAYNGLGCNSPNYDTTYVEKVLTKAEGYGYTPQVT